MPVSYMFYRFFSPDIDPLMLFSPRLVFAVNGVDERPPVRSGGRQMVHETGSNGPI